jgi:Flp pilus assembly protein TadD
VSLLQDALRRAQKPEGTPDAPSPAPLSGSRPPKPGTRWKLLLALVVAAFVVGAAGVILFSRYASPPPLAMAPPAPVPSLPPAAGETVQPAAGPSPHASAGPKAPLAAPVKRDGRRAPTERLAGQGEAATDGGPAVVSNKAPAPEPVAGPNAAGESAGASALKKFNAGVAALDHGDAAEAVRLFREVTEGSPDLVEAWNGLGLGLLRERKFDGADAAFRRCLALAPRYVPALINAGLLRLAEGRIEEGSALFLRAAELSPDSPAPRVNLAVAQSRLGRFDEAEETLLAARRRFPRDPDVLYQLGVVYDRMGNRQESAEAYGAFLSASAGSSPSLEEQVRSRLRSLGASAPRR